jgi:hypothetical protein
MNTDYKKYVKTKESEIVDFIIQQFAKAKIVQKKSNKLICSELGMTHTTYLNFSSKAFSMSLKNVIHILDYFGYTFNVVRKGREPKSVKQQEEVNE